MIVIIFPRWLQIVLCGVVDLVWFNHRSFDREHAGHRWNRPFLPLRAVWNGTRLVLGPVFSFFLSSSSVSIVRSAISLIACLYWLSAVLTTTTSILTSFGFDYPHQWPLEWWRRLLNKHQLTCANIGLSLLSLRSLLKLTNVPSPITRLARGLEPTAATLGNRTDDSVWNSSDPAPVSPRQTR